MGSCLVAWKPQEKEEEKSFEIFGFSVWGFHFFSYGKEYADSEFQISISINFLGLCFIVANGFCVQEMLCML
jgi:hypothetical protein